MTTEPAPELKPDTPETFDALIKDVERLGKIKTERLAALMHCINAIKDDIDRTKNMANTEKKAWDRQSQQR